MIVNPERAHQFPQLLDIKSMESTEDFFRGIVHQNGTQQLFAIQRDVLEKFASLHNLLSVPAQCNLLDLRRAGKNSGVLEYVSYNSNLLRDSTDTDEHINITFHSHASDTLDLKNTRMTQELLQPLSERLAEILKTQDLLHITVVSEDAGVDIRETLTHALSEEYAIVLELNESTPDSQEYKMVITKHPAYAA